MTSCGRARMGRCRLTAQLPTSSRSLSLLPSPHHPISCTSMAISPSPQLLSLLQLREALTTLELLQSFFPLPGELVVSLETTILLPRLEAWIEEQESVGSSGSKGKGKGTEELAWGEKARGGLEFVLRLELRRAGDEDRGDGGDRNGEASEWVVEMSVVIPLLGTTSTATPPRPDGVRKASTGTTLESSPISYGRQLPKLSVLQPSWLSRSQHIDLVNQFTTLLTLPSSPSTPSTSQTDLVSDDDITTILAAIETLKDLSQSLIPDLSLSNLSLSTPEEIEEEFRVFYHFPSLSTKAKRKDLVDWAAEYGLTGFVLAGQSLVLPSHHMGLIDKSRQARDIVRGGTTVYD